MASWLAASWPREGPRRLWSRELGDGFSAILADGERLYTMLRRGNENAALHVPTGRVAWQDRRFPKATLLLAAGKVIVLDEDGRLALATLTPEGMTVHSEAQILTKLAWTVPTLVGSRLYVRDRATIAAYDVGP